MPENYYQIRFLGLTPAITATDCKFGIRTEESAFSFTVRLTDPLKVSWAVTSDEEVETILLRLGFEKVVEELRRGNREDAYLILLSSDTCPRDMPQLIKPCEHLIRDPRMMRCAIADSRDKTSGRTTPQVCEACAYPEPPLRCKHLINATTIGTQAYGRPIHRWVIGEACAKGKGDINTRECWRRDCFEPPYVDLGPSERPRLGFLEN